MFITMPFSVIIFQDSLKYGINPPKIASKHIFFIIPEVVSNNWMSYMTNKILNHQTKDVLSCSILILVSFTLIHSTTTYIFIRIYLWVKHSKTIIRAEKSLDFNILGFKKLLIFISLLCFCMLSTFLVHENKLYSIEHSSAPPPIMVLSAVLAAFLGVFFIWNKPDIRSFVKRRISGTIESLFPNLSLGRGEKSRKIMPKLSGN